MEDRWHTDTERRDMTVWLFDEDSFVPVAMIKEGRSYSILTDQLGTPTEAYDAAGNEVWSRVIDMDGNVIEETGNKGMVPFLFQGQYYDRETGLAYNRFRYYSPKMGMYVSQDPIGLAGGIFNLYGYVEDTNLCLDLLGLYNHYRKKNGKYAKKPGRKKKKNNKHGNSVDNPNPRQHYVISDEQGKVYHGVGDVKGQRAKQSLGRLSAENPEHTFEIISQTNHTNSRTAYKAEAQGIKETGGVQSPNNYNVRNSPGAKLITSE